MAIKVISGILILITVFLNFKHGWSGISGKMSAGEMKMMNDIGIGKSWFLPIGIISLAIGLMVLFPQTFFIGNIANAAMILLIMGLALKAGVTKIALIEIPFLLIPLVLIWLGYPLGK